MQKCKEVIQKAIEKYNAVLETHGAEGEQSTDRTQSALLHPNADENEDYEGESSEDKPKIKKVATLGKSTPSAKASIRNTDGVEGGNNAPDVTALVNRGARGADQSEAAAQILDVPQHIDDDDGAVGGPGTGSAPSAAPVEAPVLVQTAEGGPDTAPANADEVANEGAKEKPDEAAPEPPAPAAGGDPSANPTDAEGRPDGASTTVSAAPVGDVHGGGQDLESPQNSGDRKSEGVQTTDEASSAPTVGNTVPDRNADESSSNAGPEVQEEDTPAPKAKKVDAEQNTGDNAEDIELAQNPELVENSGPSKTPGPVQGPEPPDITGGGPSEEETDGPKVPGAYKF